MNTKEKKEELVSFRMTAKQRATLTAKAKKSNITRSNLIREILFKRLIEQKE